MSESSATPQRLRSFDETRRPTPSGDAGADRDDRSGSMPTASPGQFDQGTVLGRYVLLDRLGQGGGGAVFVAYDPKLDRKVALKIVRGSGPSDTERMLVEAQAMARVDDHNVVSVFDVGEQDEVVFVAMELVVGETLASWTRRSARGWGEIVAAYHEAGRGLVAVHRAGLVHGDFKPENVLVSDEGDVRVADFGLARASSDASTTQPGEDEEIVSIVGTPAYMSPEQFRGARATARSDQFSFCVALHEALLGERPFAGNDLAALKRAVIAGKRVERSRNRVPGRLLEVIDRGLSTHPNRRFDTMAELLAAIDRVLRAARWRTAGWAAGGLSVLTGALLLATPDDDPCSNPETQLRQAWSDSARTSIENAFIGVDARFGAAAWANTSSHLDGYVQRFSAATTELCSGEATPVANGAIPRSDRVECLAQASIEAMALVDTLATADATGLRTSAPAVLSLPDPQRCTSGTPLPLLPGNSDPELAWARSEFARARVQMQTGDYAAALATTADFDDYWSRAPRFHVLLLRERARAQMLARQLDGAQQTIDEAMRRCAEIGDDDIALGLWLDTAELAIRRGDGSGKGLQRPVELATIAAGRPAAMELQITDTMTRLAAGNGDFAAAEAGANRTLELVDDDTVDPFRAAAALANVASVWQTLGRFGPARDAGQRSVALSRKLFGDEHPRTARSRNNVAIACQGLGDYDCAINEHRAALEAEVVALGPNHPQVGLTHYNLAVTQLERGDPDQADVHATAAENVWQEQAEPDQIRLAALAALRANIASGQGNLGESLRHNARAVRTYRELGGLRDARLARQLGSRGVTLAELGRAREAVDTFDEALSIWNEIDATHPQAAYAWVGKARALLDLGRASEAVSAAAVAVKLREQAGDAPRRIAYAQFEEARARWAADEDRPHALELARSASKTYSALDSEVAGRKVAEIQAWLATVTGS